MSIITVATSKGGGGKTALTIALAVTMAKRGFKIGVIDADPNATFHRWHQSVYEGPAFDAIRESRDGEIIPAAQLMDEDHDVVLIDTAGFSNQTAAMAMGIADIVLIPCMPDGGSANEAFKTMKTVANLSQVARRQIPCRVVLSRWSARGLAERATLSELRDNNVPMLNQALSDLSDWKKMTYSGEMPTTGRIYGEVCLLIGELTSLEAVPAITERTL